MIDKSTYISFNLNFMQAKELTDNRRPEAAFAVLSYWLAAPVDDTFSCEQKFNAFDLLCLSFLKKDTDNDRKIALRLA